MANKGITINNWQEGIGTSVNTGFANIKNCDIESIPGCVLAAHQSDGATHNPRSSTTFTVDTGTDEIIVSEQWHYNTREDGVNYAADGMVVQFTDGGDISTDITAATNYWITRTSNTRFKISTSYENWDAGTFVDLTDAGTGSNTVDSVDMARPMNFAYDPNTESTFAQTYDGEIWKQGAIAGDFVLVDGNTLTSASGNGLVVWKDYLFAFRDLKIDVMKISDSTWTNDWQTTTSNANHYAIHGQDDVLYFCNGLTLGSITEDTAPFAPGTTASYAYVTDAINPLPSRTFLTYLEELGDNLVIGTSKNIIYFWDYSNTDYTGRVYWNESNVDAMKTIGNNTYILGGTRGIIYATNGVVVQEVKRIPAELSGSYPSSIRFWAADQMGSELLFTVSGTNAGVYSLNLTTGALTLKNQVSQTYIAQETVTCLHVFNGNAGSYIFGRSNETLATAGGIDIVLTSGRRQQSYKSIVETALMRVGTSERKMSVRKIYVDFNRELATGHGVKVYYRENMTDSYTAIGTFDNTTYGAVASMDKTFSRSLENIQLKAEITTYTGSSTSPQLREIRIR